MAPASFHGRMSPLIAFKGGVTACTDATLYNGPADAETMEIFERGKARVLAGLVGEELREVRDLIAGVQLHAVRVSRAWPVVPDPVETRYRMVGLDAGPCAEWMTFESVDHAVFRLAFAASIARQTAERAGL